jgi:hypothetical protein
MKELPFLMNHPRRSSRTCRRAAPFLEAVLAQFTGSRKHQDRRRLVGLVGCTVVVARCRRGMVSGGRAVTVYYRQ